MKLKAVSGLLLILLFLGVLPFVFYVQPTKSDPSTIIVPDDYEKIQWAIGNASDGDTVFVRAGTYWEHVIVDKSVFLSGENSSTTILDGNATGTIIIIANDLVKVSGFTIQNSGSYPDSGIYLNNTNNCEIMNNRIVCNINGIKSSNSSKNHITENDVTNNTCGIILDYSSNNTISGNNITKNFQGLILGLSSNNVISGNNVIGNGAGIWLSHCTNNTITGNSVRNNADGVYFELSSDNRISRNNITTSSSIGIALNTASNGNEISENKIENNDIGTAFRVSSNNNYHHNNFLNNVQQVWVVTAGYINFWDDGYPFGGNYWTDYSGVDFYCGPHQNETGSDGIGDTPYTIDGTNQDKYPLKNPFPSIHDIAIKDVNSKTVVGQSPNFTTQIHVDIVNQGHYLEAFNVTVYANTTLIGAVPDVILTHWDFTTRSFTWNTTSFAKGNYTITANATIVAGEIETADNTYTYWFLITIVGDVDGDRDVDVGDQRKMQLVMFTTPASPNWNPNMDVDCDGDVDVGDQRKQQLHMFESW